MQNLPAVAHVVAVAIPVAGVRADDKLLHVSEAVTVEVGVEAVHGHVELDARVEALKHLRCGDLDAPDDVIRVEALEDEELAVPRLAEIGPLGAISCRRSPDLGLVPEEVLPAVGHGVGIGVLHGRIHAVLLALASRLGAPQTEIGRRGVEPVVGRKRLPRLLLGVAEARIARRQARLVEAVVEAAELEAVVERIADRRVARELLVDERQLALRLPHAGDVVLVRVSGGEIGEVGLGLVGAGHRRDERIDAVAPRGDREIVGDAVLVDVAQVVLGLPFLREHGLGVDGNVRLVLGRRRRQVGGRRLGLRARLLGRERERPVGRATLGLRSRHEPGVEEAVLRVVGIGIEPGGDVGGRGLGRARAGLVEREVHAVVEPAVVERSDAVAPCIHVDGRRGRAVPPLAPVGAVGERRAGDIDVAFAAAALEGSARILLGEVAVAEARRSVRNRRQELGRSDEIHVRPRLQAAVLVLYRENDGLVLLARAEIRDERAAPLVGVGHVECRLVVAALEGHLDAGTFARGPDGGEIVAGIVLDCPADRVGISRAARDVPRVRVLGRDVAELGRQVVDVDLGLVRRVVLGPRHRRVGGYPV